MPDSVVVVRVPTVVTAAASGPQGPPGATGPAGAAGPPGPAGGAVEHVQTVPAATWVIDHGLGRKVQVSVFDVTGTVVYADITHGSVNQTTIAFAGPAGGSAVLR